MPGMDAKARPGLTEPWFRPEPGRTAGLERELAAEIGPGHELSGHRLTAIAKCGGCDTVAFQVDDGTFAIVHLTWGRHPEPGSLALNAAPRRNRCSGGCNRSRRA